MKRVKKSSYTKNPFKNEYKTFQRIIVKYLVDYFSFSLLKYIYILNQQNVPT